MEIAPLVHDDIERINALIGKLDDPILKILHELTESKEEFEYMKLRVILFLEFGTPMVVKKEQQNTTETNTTYGLENIISLFKENSQPVIVACIDVVNWKLVIGKVVRIITRNDPARLVLHPSLLMDCDEPKKVSIRRTPLHLLANETTGIRLANQREMKLFTELTGVK